MKKLKAVIVLIIVCVSACTGQGVKSNVKVIKNDLTEEGIKGKVRSLTETEYRTVGTSGEIKKGTMINKGISLFNESGNLTTASYYNPDGSQKSRYTYTYDAKGNRVEECQYKSDGSLESKTTCKYDIKGNKTEENRYNSGGSLENKTTCKYNVYGKMIESSAYLPDGSLDSKYTYKYDIKGNRIEQDLINADGSLYSKDISTYDARGNEATSISYDSDGALDSKIINAYDARGNMIKYSVYKQENKNWSLYSTFNFSYDDYRNMLEETGSFDKNIKCTYTYDKNFNWVTKTESDNQRPPTITEREIVYYSGVQDKSAAGSTQLSGTFTDTRDGKVYKTVTIGTKTWMAENLAYKAEGGCWAYDNNPDNVKTFGYLYTWFSAKKASPSGWHPATKDEWSALTTYLGGESTAAEKLKEAGTVHWQKPVSAATNETGFTCLPGGFRNDKGEFYNLGLMCFFWCSTEEDTERADQILIFSHTKSVTISYIEKNNGFSVRCVKD